MYTEYASTTWIKYKIVIVYEAMSSRTFIKLAYCSPLALQTERKPLARYCMLDKLQQLLMLYILVESINIGRYTSLSLQQIGHSMDASKQLSDTIC